MFFNLFFDCYLNYEILSTVEPRLNEPLFNEVPDILNDILCPGQSYSKRYVTEPRYNEFFDITNIIRKPKRKIYLDITNYNHGQHATEDKRWTDQQSTNLLILSLLMVKRQQTFRLRLILCHRLIVQWTSALFSLSLISSLNLFTFEDFLWYNEYVAGISSPMPLFLRLRVTSTEINLSSVFSISCERFKYQRMTEQATFLASVVALSTSDDSWLHLNARPIKFTVFPKVSQVITYVYKKNPAR